MGRCNVGLLIKSTRMFILKFVMNHTPFVNSASETNKNKGKLTIYNQAKLKQLYSVASAIVSQPGQFPDPVGALERVEKEINMAWGYSGNEKQSILWNQMKGCICSEQVNKQCKWHGEK